jgi:hypothetical protein
MILGRLKNRRKTRMAKPISATPVVKGKDAELIQRELVRGTPDTPQRVQWMRDSDNLFKRVNERLTGR